MARSARAVRSSAIKDFVQKKFASRGFLVVLCSAFALLLPFVLSHTHGGSLRAIFNPTPDQPAAIPTEVSTTDSVATSNTQGATSTPRSVNGTDPATAPAATAAGATSPTAKAGSNASGRPPSSVAPTEPPTGTPAPNTTSSTPAAG